MLETPREVQSAKLTNSSLHQALEAALTPSGPRRPTPSSTLAAPQMSSFGLSKPSIAAPLLRPPLPMAPTAPTTIPTAAGRFLQPQLAPNQPPPTLICPALAASHNSARPPQSPSTLIGAPLEPLGPHSEP
ncbi:REST corepressor 2 [Plecturocebus cupreus]